MKINQLTLSLLLAGTYLTSTANAAPIFEIISASENDGQFFTYDLSKNGELLKESNKINILPQNISSSGNTRWYEIDANGENTISIMGLDQVKRYYQFDMINNPLYTTPQTDLSNNVNSDFINISSNTKEGGALVNTENNILESVNGDFIGNKNTNSYAYGAALFNKGYIKSVNGNFIANSGKYGSAIYNTGTIDTINSHFLVNHAGYTGNVLYNMGKIGKINGDFVGNYNYKGTYLDGGRALANRGEIDEINSNFIANYATTNNASAIFNQGKIGKIKGSFIFNIASAGTEVYGGALDNFPGAGIVDIEADFIGNWAKAGFDGNGGAMSTRSVVDSISGNFFDNRATSTRGEVNGGAIHNTNNPIGNISASFVNNYVSTTAENQSALGGAIFSNQELNLSTKGENRFFSGNYTYDTTRGKNYNALFISGTSTSIPNVTFDTSGGGAWIINDNIEGGRYSTSPTVSVDYSQHYNLTFKGDDTLNNDGLTEQYISVNNDIINAGSVTVNNTTLRFGSYQHEDSNANNGNGKGGFWASADSKGIVNKNDESVTSLTLNNAAFDIYNDYQENIKLNGYSANNSFLHIDIDVENLTADILNVNGNIEGQTKLVLYPNSDKDIRGQSILFAQSVNDEKGNEDSFKVWRVYRSPFMFDVIYTKTDAGKEWSLEMNNTENDYAGIDPEERPDPEIPDIHPNIPNGPIEVAPEVIGSQALPSAAIAQNTNLVYNVMSKVSKNLLHPSVANSYNYNKNTWVNPIYTDFSIKSPTQIEADVWGLEAGADLQYNLNNKLGIFASYRKGDYDVNGKGKHYYSSISSEIKIDSYLLGTYYRYDKDNLWVFATLYGGIQQADISTKDGVKSDTDGMEFGGSAEIGYDYVLTNDMYMTPSLGVFYTQIDYEDAKDNVGKKARYSNFNQLEIEAGIKLSKLFRLESSYADVYIKPSFVQTVINGDEMRMTNLGKVDTMDDRSLGRMEFGARYGFSNNLSAYGWANYTFGNDYDATSLGLGLNYAF